MCESIEMIDDDDNLMQFIKTNIYGLTRKCVIGQCKTANEQPHGQS